VITLVVYSVALGTILGIWCRAVVLVPIMLAGTLILVSTAVIQGAEISRTATAIVVLCLLIQAAYACASLIKHAVMPNHSLARGALLASELSDQGAQTS
jgi:hypothetical protein